MTHQDRHCSLWYCNGDHYALGFCMGHYQNLRRHGDVVAPTEKAQLALRDMCEELANLSMDVVSKMSNEFCPMCGGEPGKFHKNGCEIERLAMLALRVRSTRYTLVGEEA